MIWVVIDRESKNILGEFPTAEEAWSLASQLKGEIEIVPVEDE